MKFFEDQKYNDKNNADLQDTKGCEFSECEFLNIDFTNYSFANSKFLDCKFINCNLSNISTPNASFRDLIFKNCKIIGVNWSQTSSLSFVEFHDCVLDYGIFQNMKLSGAKILNCSAKEVDFSESNFSKAIFSGSNLLNSNFNMSNLESSDFRGAFNYSIDIKETKIKKAKFNMPEAMELLKGLGVIIE